MFECHHILLWCTSAVLSGKRAKRLYCKLFKGTRIGFRHFSADSESSNGWVAGNTALELALFACPQSPNYVPIVFNYVSS